MTKAPGGGGGSGGRLGRWFKVWVGLKKVGDFPGRFPGVNGGECRIGKEGQGKR